MARVPPVSLARSVTRRASGPPGRRGPAAAAPSQWAFRRLELRLESLASCLWLGPGGGACQPQSRVSRVSAAGARGQPEPEPGPVTVSRVTSHESTSEPRHGASDSHYLSEINAGPGPVTDSDGVLLPSHLKLPRPGPAAIT